ncbi:MAG: hypothetical protein KC910_28470 [Candidatus Eremiobacteraeota bacterium]|nr:hypothetical protein [Candidatus Eremiobacteraeota bacterium]
MKRRTFLGLLLLAPALQAGAEPAFLERSRQLTGFHDLDESRARRIEKQLRSEGFAVDAWLTGHDRATEEAALNLWYQELSWRCLGRPRPGRCDPAWM